MFGNNPIRTPDHADGHSLAVQEVFLTFQGEGPHTGIPAVFVRLGGCNLACSFCDTEFESFADMTLETLLAAVQQVNTDHANLIVITGGEPLRQNIAPLCEALLQTGYRVQIETNGTLFRKLPDAVDIICSPKATGGHYHPIRPDLLARTTAFKFIISASQPPYDTVPTIGQAHHNTPVYVQPMDEYDPQKNRANIQHARMLAQANGAMISHQTHKLAGVR